MLLAAGMTVLFAAVLNPSPRPRAVRLQERDLPALKDLHERRVLSVRQAARHFGGEKAALDRLGKLSRAGYVERLTYVDNPDGPVPAARRAYALRPKGLGVLVRRGLVPPETLDGRRRVRIASSTVAHDLALNDIEDAQGVRFARDHLGVPRGPQADGRLESAADSLGRTTVYVELDSGHYSRARIESKVTALVPDAKALAFVSPTAARAALVRSQAARVLSPFYMSRCHFLTAEELKTTPGLLESL